MNLEIKLFAAAKDIVGSHELKLEVPDGCDIAELKRQLAIQFPDLSAMLEKSRFAVGQKYVSSDQFQLQPNHEIAFIPPVSGG